MTMSIKDIQQIGSFDNEALKLVLNFINKIFYNLFTFTIKRL